MSPLSAMSAISACLAELRFGPVQTCGRLSLYPLVNLAAPRPAEYGLSGPALASGALTISEVSETGTVSRLAARNEGAGGVLLLDGEELVGAKQNRILNVTVLVAARSSAVLPVSCVEQGRWRYHSPTFSAGEQVLFSKARSRKSAFMAAQRRAVGDGHTPRPDMFETDQMAIWEDVSDSVARSGGRSDTSAMSASYEAERERLEAFGKAFHTVPGQVGAVFCIDGHPAGLELLETEALFAGAFARLLRGHGLSALHQGNTEALGQPIMAADFAARCAASRAVASPSVGEGVDISLEGAGITGSALCLEGRILHLAAFSRTLFDAPTAR